MESTGSDQFHSDSELDTNLRADSKWNQVVPSGSEWFQSDFEHTLNQAVLYCLLPDLRSGQIPNSCDEDLVKSLF